MDWRIRNGLADWHRIGPGLADWSRIGELVMDWQIGNGLVDSRFGQHREYGRNRGF